MTFTQARTASEIVKAQMGALRLRERQGQLINKAAAMDAVFGLAREQRDAWQAWPSRISALMAAALGVSAHAVEALLAKEVKAHLATLAAVDVERIGSPSRGKGTVQ